MLLTFYINLDYYIAYKNKYININLGLEDIFELHHTFQIKIFIC